MNLGTRIILGLTVTLVILSALPLDDYNSSYNATDKTYTVSKLGFDYATVTLESPEVNKVIRGKDRLVGEITIRSLEDNDAFFNMMEFIDNRTGESLRRGFTMRTKYYDYRNVTDYAEVCNPFVHPNSSADSNCTLEIKGSHLEPIPKWDDRVWVTLGKGQNTTIGIFTDVQPNERIDWVPTMWGERLSAFAVWDEALEEGLRVFYQANSTARDTLIEATKSMVGEGNMSMDLTGIDDTDWVDGKISNAITFALDDTEYGATTTNIGITGNDASTMCGWVNMSANNAGHGVIGFGSAATNQCRMFGVQVRALVSYGYNNEDKSADGTFNQLNEWAFICHLHGNGRTVLMTNTTVILNVSNSLNTAASTVRAGNNKCTASWGQGGGWDEFGIWNRTLSAGTEVVQLYNDGLGLTYGVQATDCWIETATELIVPAGCEYILDTGIDIIG